MKSKKEKIEIKKRLVTREYMKKHYGDVIDYNEIYIQQNLIDEATNDKIV